MEALKNVKGDGDDGMVEVNMAQLGVCFDIMGYSVVKRSFDALYNYVFQKISIELMDLNKNATRLVRLPSTSVQTGIVDRYWAPWARTVAMWLLAAGACPYYTVSLGEIIGKAPNSTLEAAAVWNQRIPVVPSWREGTFRTGRRGRRYTGQQKYAWVWANGEKDRGRIRWITEPTCTPCPVTGNLNSIISSLIPEWENLIQMARRLDIVEDLRAMPPLIIRQEQMAVTTYNDRYAGGSGGPGGIGAGPGSYEPITAEAAYNNTAIRQLRTQMLQEEALKRAADAAYTRMYCISKAFEGSTTGAADEVWEYHKERRVLLPVGCHMDKSPEVGGLTREEWNIAMLTFENHATSLINFPTEMWGQTGSTRPMNPTYSRVGYDISSVLEHAISARKAQFVEIIQSAFIHANRDLFEEDYRYMRVRLPTSKRAIWPELWGRYLIRVELGPGPSATIEELVFARDQGIIDNGTMKRLARYMIGVERIEDAEPEPGYGTGRIFKVGEVHPLPLVGQPQKRTRKGGKVEKEEGEEKEEVFEPAKKPVLPRISNAQRTKKKTKM